MLPCAIVERIIEINMKYNVLHTSRKRDNDLFSLLESYRFDYGIICRKSTGYMMIKKIELHENEY